MELEEAIQINHICGDSKWIIVLAVGIVATLFGIFLKKQRKIRIAMIITSVLSYVIYAVVSFNCFRSYVYIGSLYAEHEYPYENGIIAEPVDNNTIMLTNNGAESISINNYYKVERYLSNTLFYMQDDVSNRDLVYDTSELVSGQSMMFTFDLADYGNLKPGHYRLACSPEYSMHYYFVEFDILDNGEFVWCDI